MIGRAWKSGDYLFELKFRIEFILQEVVKFQSITGSTNLELH